MARLSRRFVLGGAVAAAVGVGGLGVGLELQPSTPRVPSAPLRVLTPRQFAALVAVAERVCPAIPGLPSAVALGVPEKVDALLDRLDPGAAGEVAVLLALFESPTVGLLFGRVPRPFSRLAPDAQDRVLAAWRDSRFATRRTAWKALVGLVKSAYWSDRATDAHVRYTRMEFPS